MFRFSPVIAPVKVTVFPLLQREDLNKPSQAIASALKAEGLSVVIDTTGAPALRLLFDVHRHAIEWCLLLPICCQVGHSVQS